MQNNNFRQDLMVAYLSSLVDYGYSEEFDRLFSMYESYIKEVVASSTDKELLEKAKKVLSFREKSLRVAM